MIDYSDPRISHIIKLEIKITDAILKGHKASDDDEFQSDRLELKQLREELQLKRRAQ